MGLYVGVIRTEELFRPIDREDLDLVDFLAATVVAPPGIALGIFVGQNRTDRFEYRLGYEILRRDQLDRKALTSPFPPHESRDIGICSIEIGRHGLLPALHRFLLFIMAAAIFSSPAASDSRRADFARLSTLRSTATSTASNPVIHRSPESATPIQKPARDRPVRHFRRSAVIQP